MTVVMLYMWVIVAGKDPGSAVRDWRPMGEFASAAHCEKAKAQLGYTTNERARCVDTGRALS